MSVNGEDQRVRPRAAWYAVPVVCWLVGAVLFTLSLIELAEVVNAGVDDIGTGAALASVSVPADGLTFYTTDPSANADCSLAPQGGSRVSLDALKISFDISTDGRTYHALGVTTHELAPGRYTLTCSGVASNALIGTGPRVDVTAIATRALWGLVLPVVLGVAGLIVLIIVIVKRHSSRSRLQIMRAYARTGSGAAWSPSSGQDGPMGPPGGGSTGSSGTPPPPPPPPPSPRV